VKIFISWAGSDSKAIAIKLHAFVKKVLPTIDVFISTEDIRGGDRWFDVIGTALEDSDFGITVVTKSSLSRPWLYFEAGALAKRLGKSRLMPVLCGVGVDDLRDGPLFLFNAVHLTKDGIRGALKVIRDETSYSMSDQDLDESFEVWWGHKGPDLVDLSFTKGGSASPVQPEPKLSEISAQIQQLSNTMNSMSRDVRIITDERARPKAENFIISDRPNLVYKSEGDDVRYRRYLDYLLLNKGDIILAEAKASPADESGKSSPDRKGARLERAPPAKKQKKE
jgi:hypothetical protein